MVRTQLYLDDDIYRVLKNLSAKTRRTISDLLRDALRKVYGPRHGDARMAAVEGVFGIWKGRRDMGTTDSYVRALRKDTRRKRAA
jgi:hypothetical protein